VAPWLLRESRSELRHRHFDVAGATSITAGLMVLVYALTRTATSGWGDSTTIALLAGSVLLIAAFIAIEHRSTAPLLPLRIFRRRTLAAANGIAALVTAAGFSQFFLLTLYMQQVLHYSPLQTGAGFATTTLAIVLFANVGQKLVTRFGVRPVLASGLLLVAVSLALLTQLPTHGHYFWDLFPAYLVGGIGMAFTFVPMTIAGLTGVSGADAGIASGLINTSRQIGGAVGLAAVSTIAATSASHGLTASLAADSPDRVLRPDRPHVARRRDRGRLRGTGVPTRGGRCRGGRCIVRHRHRASRGGSMTTVNHHHVDGEQLLAHEIDDLLLQARGLVLVRDILAERGASRNEIDAHSDELARVRAQLVATIGVPEEARIRDAA
jgi:hypothetical protein